MSKTFAVFYIDPEYWRMSAYPVELSLELFHARYTYVGDIPAKNIDELFKLLNNAAGIPNPLGDPVRQRLVIAPAKHTSMSVGDLAVDLDSGKAQVCQASGWSEVSIT